MSPADERRTPAQDAIDALRRFVNVYLNDEDVRFLDGLATVVAEDDTVTILPAVAGGSTTAELQ